MRVLSQPLTHTSLPPIILVSDFLPSQSMSMELQRQRWEVPLAWIILTLILSLDTFTSVELAVDTSLAMEAIVMGMLEWVCLNCTHVRSTIAPLAMLCSSFQNFAKPWEASKSCYDSNVYPIAPYISDVEFSNSIYMAPDPNTITKETTAFYNKHTHNAGIFPSTKFAVGDALTVLAGATNLNKVFKVKSFKRNRAGVEFAKSGLHQPQLRPILLNCASKVTMDLSFTSIS